MRIVRIPWTQRTRHVSLALLAAGFAVSGTYSYGAVNASSDPTGGSGGDAVAAAWRCPADVQDAANSARWRGCGGGGHKPSPTSTTTTASATSTTAPPSTTSTSKPPTTTTTTKSATTTTTKPPTTTTAPTTTTTSSSQPTIAGFPNAGNTGVPSGVALTTYSGPMVVTTPGTVIDAKVINGDMVIATTGVRITRSRFVNGSVATRNSSANGQRMVDISDTEIQVGARNQKAVVGSFLTVLRSELTGGISGGWCSDCTIQDTYIHGQYATKGEGWHESGYRMDQRTRFIHNAVTCDAPVGPNDGGCSAGLTGYGDFQAVQDNLIDSNLFMTSPDAAFCAYGGSSAGKPYSSGTRNIVFSNNVFARGANRKCATYAPIGDWTNAPGNQWTNNKWEDGTTVTP